MDFCHRRSPGILVLSKLPSYVHITATNETECQCTTTAL